MGDFWHVRGALSVDLLNRVLRALQVPPRDLPSLPGLSPSPIPSRTPPPPLSHPSPLAPPPRPSPRFSPSSAPPPPSSVFLASIPHPPLPRRPSLCILQRWTQPVIMIPGNHDQVCQTIPHTARDKKKPAALYDTVPASVQPPIYPNPARNAPPRLVTSRRDIPSHRHPYLTVLHPIIPLHIVMHHRRFDRPGHPGRGSARSGAPQVRLRPGPGTNT